jgi:hypothetical protein
MRDERAAIPEIATVNNIFRWLGESRCRKVKLVEDFKRKRLTIAARPVPDEQVRRTIAAKMPSGIPLRWRGVRFWECRRRDFVHVRRGAAPGYLRLAHWQRIVSLVTFGCLILCDAVNFSNPLIAERGTFYWLTIVGLALNVAGASLVIYFSMLIRRERKDVAP